VTDEPPTPLYEAPAARPPLVYVPWTDDQVASLVAFQRDARWHEFTCGRCGATLNPRVDGWHCWRDDYRQNWAHEFMTNWAWRNAVDWERELLNPDPFTDDNDDDENANGGGDGG
jgi:hypothetical protein